MTPSVINHTGLPYLQKFPQTSQSLRQRRERTPRTTSCLSTCGVHRKTSWRTLLDWGCSNTHWWVLWPNGTSSFLMPLTPISPHLPQCSFNTLIYPSNMMREWRSFYPVIKIQLPTSQIISMSGDVDVSCERSNWIIWSSLNSFWKPYSHP